MSDGIYLIEESGRLVEMREAKYDSEDLLQGLLAEYPNLLAGDQMDPSRPRRWLLVSRERGVPSEEGGSSRWSVDHLFLDQDAVPTIVEVKRSTDTRIRREVVGQMLDYAANAVVYWPVEAIRAEFETNVDDPQQSMADLLIDADTDEDEFWKKAKTNLQAGRIRLVFVADEIPAELRRIVEFLNQQMDPAEVLAVEIKQYVGGALRTMVPRVVGQTVKATTPPGTIRTGGQWDETSFFRELEAQAPKAVAPARAIFDWSKANASRIVWGKGKHYGTFSPAVDCNGSELRPVQVWTGDYFYMQFKDLQNKAPFDEPSKLLELLNRCNGIPSVDFSEGDLNKYPIVTLSALSSGDFLKQFLGVLDWIVEEARAVDR